MSLLLLLTLWIGTAHHHTAGTVSVSSVSWLGCVGDGRCVSAVCILALPTVVLLEYHGIVNIDGCVVYKVRVCRACFLFWKFPQASCFIDEIPRLNEHATLFLVLWATVREIESD